MKSVSIIVPIYGVEEYLERCVQSLMHQTYTNIQIILVDDGSPDGCSVICDKLAKMDSRILVIHKANGGLSDARNAGLKIASGELIAFVDSDDWVATDYIKTMVRVMEQQASDIVDCNLLRTYGEVTKDVAESENARNFTASQALAMLICDNEFHQHVWNKLYTKEVIKDIFFEKGKCNEDEFWTYQVFGRAKRITKIDTVLYYYFQRNGSIMGQEYKLSRLDAIEAKIQRQRYIEANYTDLKDEAGTNLLWSIIYAGQMSIKYLDDSERSEALCILKTYIGQIKGISIVGTIQDRIWLQAAKKSLNLVCTIRNRLNIGF